ncbi:MAG: hypothetical protein KAH38_11735 [Candidatus Hydrogenedentes bacterium]|nr:hypothetical protein [Candidatus Hydrogenedentota bacterium]
MIVKHSLIFIVICGIAGTMSADPMRYPYWQMIKESVSSIEAQPPRPQSISENNHKTNIEYPFEMLRHLRAADLLRAAVEGAQKARLQAALGKSENEIETLVLKNVSLALEYLPMLIRSESDLEEIALLMAKREEDKVLRLYLLQNSFPGFAAPSFLSLSFSEIIPDNEEVFSKWTHHIASHPSEYPELQCVALRICYAKLLQQYNAILINDPAVAILMATTNDQDALTLTQKTPVELSKDTHTALKQCRRKFHNFAFEIAGHIAEGSVRDERVKEITRQILEEMCSTIPNISKGIITTFLEGKPFVSTPFPQLPTEEDSSEIEGSAPPLRLDKLIEQNPPG